ncbi:MAG: ABC transporter substrate-binding protein [Alteromonas sp.]|nr:ABC transporter substrate-binding protein [Alteromonas sp.]
MFFGKIAIYPYVRQTDISKSMQLSSGWYMAKGVKSTVERRLTGKRYQKCVASLFCCVLLSFLNSALAFNEARSSQAQQAAPQASFATIVVIYIKVAGTSPPGTPDYLKSPSNEGTAGASVAIEDANITGKFLGYQFELTEISVPSIGELQASLAKTRQHSASGANANHKEISSNQQGNIAPVVLLDMQSSDKLKAASIESLITTIQNTLPNAVFFNVANSDDLLRQNSCRLPLFHTIPSYQMKADALAQWFRTKRVDEIFAVYGKTADDAAYLAAFKRSAKKFKLSLVETKQWQDSFDLRRAAFAEIPQFTRTTETYQAVFTADSAAQFAYSLPFNTYYPVPVVGAAGLKALGWHFTHEQWGARQLQSRFNDGFNRHMNEVDFAAYLAVTAVANAAQQGSDLTQQGILKTLLSDHYTLGAYKGSPLSIRPYTHQFRQPIALAHEDALVTHAPLEGFLHQTNELDTLGATHTTCKDKL